jgi:hypothetical protein
MAIWVNQAGEIYLADTASHHHQTAAHRELLLALRTKGASGPDGQPFNLPTHAVEAPNGDILSPMGTAKPDPPLPAKASTPSPSAAVTPLHSPAVQPGPGPADPAPTRASSTCRMNSWSPTTPSST